MPLRDHLVFRLRQEQEARGWSDAQMAAEISKYYPMNAAAVWKLKNADPPRGVSLDEAQALAIALGFDSIDALLQANGVASTVFGKLQWEIKLIGDHKPAAYETFRDADDTLLECRSLVDQTALPPADVKRLLRALDELAATGEEVRAAFIYCADALKERVNEPPRRTDRCNNRVAGLDKPAHKQDVRWE